jgi:hypothetical protein
VSGAAHRAPSPPALTALVGELLGRGGGLGLDTSGGLLFNHSLWARDRVITALDLIDYAPRPAFETVLALAALQGTRRRVLSEEEPGRIHNERRDLRAWQAPLWLKALFGLGLSTIWGGTPAGYTTYFSSDSTPLFIILVAALARREPGILEATVARKDGRPATVSESVAEACDWIERHLNDEGLVEAGQSNPLALQQVWKDGPTSNFDEHGRMANVVRPMAYLDVQVLAAEARPRGGAPPGGPPRRSAFWPSRALCATPPSPTSGCPSGATSATPSIVIRAAGRGCCGRCSPTPAGCSPRASSTNCPRRSARRWSAASCACCSRPSCSRRPAFAAAR